MHVCHMLVHGRTARREPGSACAPWDVRASQTLGQEGTWRGPLRENPVARPEPRGAQGRASEREGRARRKAGPTPGTGPAGSSRGSHSTCPGLARAPPSAASSAQASAGGQGSLTLLWPPGRGWRRLRPAPGAGLSCGHRRSFPRALTGGCFLPTHMPLVWSLVPQIPARVTAVCHPLPLLGSQGQ